MRLDQAPIPVQDYFTRLLDGGEFTMAMENFSRGKGYNQEDLTCFFPVDRSEDDGLPPDSYGEIEFWTYSVNQEALVSFKEFLRYLDWAVTKAIDAKLNSGSDIRALQGKVTEKIEELRMAHVQYQSEINLES